MKSFIRPLLIGLLTIAIGCGGTQSEQARHVAYRCATVDIGRTLPEIGMSILQRVMAIIEAGADGWKDKLIEIGIHDGEDVLACATKAVYDALTAHPPGVQPTTPTPGALRAKAFMAEKAYEYR
jgi:hypothetical protein